MAQLNDLFVNLRYELLQTKKCSFFENGGNAPVVALVVHMDISRGDQLHNLPLYAMKNTYELLLS